MFCDPDHIGFVEAIKVLVQGFEVVAASERRADATWWILIPEELCFDLGPGFFTGTLSRPAIFDIISETPDVKVAVEGNWKAQHEEVTPRRMPIFHIRLLDDGAVVVADVPPPFAGLFVVVLQRTVLRFSINSQRSSFVEADGRG